MRFDHIKAVAQQDIQNFHRQRELIKKERTALVHQTRGLLAEYGIVINKGIAAVRRDLPGILESELQGCSLMSLIYRNKQVIRISQ